MSLKPFHFGHSLHAPWYGPPPGHPHGHDHGFCAACCHPAPACCCHAWQCRKESKELTALGKRVAAKDSQEIIKELDDLRAKWREAEVAKIESSDPEKKLVRVDLSDRVSGELLIDKPERVFIGGGCCVHLSIEYMRLPMAGDNPGMVAINVLDSEGTEMLWSKRLEESGYQVKQGIISTTPGALLSVRAVNASLRVRWCEVFSC